MSLQNVTCKICDTTGSMKHKSVYRLSGPAVGVGWLFNAGTLVWMGLWTFVAITFQSVANAETQNVADSTSGFAIFMIFLGFIGGLMGYLLTMKKKLLVCDACKSVVGTSI